MSALHHVTVLHVRGGLVGYTAAWDAQRRVAELVAAAGREGIIPPPHTLLLMEHKPGHSRQLLKLFSNVLKMFCEWPIVVHLVYISLGYIHILIFIYIGT